LLDPCCDLQVLAGPHDQRAYGAVLVADVQVIGGTGVEPLVDPDPEVAERGRTASAYLGAPSPTPPVNTSASRPPRAAVMDAMPLTRLCR